jgi:hypothetical protein
VKEFATLYYFKKYFKNSYEAPKITKWRKKACVTNNGEKRSTKPTNNLKRAAKLQTS